jgi:DNA repair protein RadC
MKPPPTKGGAALKQCQLETHPVKIVASQRTKHGSIESPIDRISRLGAPALTDAELLSLLFGNGDGVAVAEKLLTSAGCLKSLLRDDALHLSATPGMTPKRAAKLLAAAELSRRIQHSDERRPRLRKAAEIYRHLAPTLQGLRREEFHVLCFNSRNTLLRDVRVAEGTMNACPVDPREVFAAAIAARATAIVFAHNHPSGDPEPSTDDVALTRRLFEGAQLLGIHALDHVVVGDTTFVSLLERGQMP